MSLLDGGCWLSKQQFNSPHLDHFKIEELNLSNSGLLSLMTAVFTKGLPFRFRARGWSMAPFIKDGDIITVNPLKDRKPGLGDVMAFVHPETNQVVVHRIIAKRSTGFIIQGDSVGDHPDGLIPKENILGRVVDVHREGRNIWLGLGLERYIIALLSRIGLLRPIYQWIVSLRNRISRKIES